MSHRDHTRRISVGGVPLGGGAPVTVQSMTNAPAHDPAAILAQGRELAAAGCDIVRLAVPDRAAVAAFARVREESPLPLVADIHFDYKLALDALAAGVEFYRRAAALEAALPPHLFRLLKFGRMESGTVRNAVSGKTVLLGSLRAFQDEVFLDLQQGLREIGQQVQADTGCQVAVHTNDGYPAVWNPDALYDRVKNLGLPFLELEKPVMISEDFSWYQRHLPALFFFLGCGPSPALHADNFAFDESILAKGAAFWKQLAGAF